ncbi:MAG: IS4 family transposase [Chloroflexi bacterium]|nr:IS4 family transposase [Chloroflexota bacterium]
MSTLAQVSQAMQSVLTSAANAVGRTSGFTQRLSKLSAALFAQIVTFSWWDNPDASYDELVPYAKVRGLDITAQALAERFTPAAATCLQSLLGTAVQQVIETQPSSLALLKRFVGVVVQDSTVLSLPAALAPLWPGGSNAAHSTVAGLKVQLRYSLSDGALSHLDLQPARMSDQTAPMQSELLAPGTLRLADLGYFDLKLMAREAAQGSYWLTRWKVGVSVCQPGQPALDLARYLRAQRAAQIDLPIELGRDERIACRLIAVRVPEHIKAQRRRRLTHEAKRKAQAVSPARWALAGWTLLLSNVPADQLSLSEALVLARLRWQIELLFKTWKDLGHLDQSRSAQPYRILCEVYAKLLIAVFQHWVILTVVWCIPERSMRQLAQRIRKHVITLAATLTNPAQHVQALTELQRALTNGARVNKRRASPSAFQLLEQLEAT